MTVVFDASSAVHDDLATFTWAHTVVNQTGRGILVCGHRQTTYPAITSITYAGVALAEIKSVGGLGANNCAVWYLANPAIGANNVVVTLAAQSVCDWTARSFYNAGGPMAVADETENAAVVHVACQSLVGGLVLDATIGYGGVATPTAPQVNDWNPGGKGHSHKPAAAGTTTMEWTGPWAAWVLLLAVCIRPIAAGGVWWFFERWQDFMRDLRAGLVPPDVLRQRYGDLMTI